MLPEFSPSDARAVILKHWPPKDMPYRFRHLLWRGRYIAEPHKVEVLSTVRDRYAETQDPELSLLHQFLAQAPIDAKLWPKAKTKTLKALAPG